MPAAFALASVTLTAICHRVAGRYGQVLALVVSVAFALASVASVRSLGSLGLAANERRYPLTADAFRAESHQRPIAVRASIPAVCATTQAPRSCAGTCFHPGNSMRRLLMCSMRATFR